MEIGSFLELQFAKGCEHYNYNVNIARLNSGRAAIWHALRVLGCNCVWVPYYQCDTVRDFLLKHYVTVKYYHIDEKFNPVDLIPDVNEAVIIVNYFGVMSRDRLLTLSEKYDKVIIDNSQGFFTEPIEGCMNVYSARKFIGVSDGAYVIGQGAEKFTNGYPQCYSSDTSLFLLQRIEYGCEGKTYASRMINENRIDSEDIMRMSKLTYTILDGTDYSFIVKKRKDNFDMAHKLFSKVNCIDPTIYYDESCVPMVYPLVIEDDTLLKKLLDHKHFQGHWWSYLLNEVEKDSFEYWISRYIIPITIDQRYGERELCFIKSVIDG